MPQASVLKPSGAISVIRKLPLGRRLVLRLYNRALMHVSPQRRVQTYFGDRIDCDVRDMIQATIIHLGAWEPRLSSVLGKLVSTGDTIVDVGANIGYFTLLLSSLVGPDGKVIAIEALAKLADTVDHHAALNDRLNVRVVRAAVADFAGELPMFEAPRTNIGMSTTIAKRGFTRAGTSRCAPLHELLTEEERRAVTLIKIDIEGAEAPVVASILDRPDLYPMLHSIVVEASGATAEWSALFSRLLAAGFSAFDLHNDYDWLTLLDRPEERPTPVQDLPERQSDILFTRLPMEMHPGESRG